VEILCFGALVWAGKMQTNAGKRPAPATVPTGAIPGRAFQCYILLLQVLGGGFKLAERTFWFELGGVGDLSEMRQRTGKSSPGHWQNLQSTRSPV